MSELQLINRPRKKTNGLLHKNKLHKPCNKEERYVTKIELEYIKIG